MKIKNMILMAVLILFVFVGGSGLLQTGPENSVVAQAPTPSPFEPVRSVSVNGVGQVNVTPDEAIVVIGVETQAEAAGEAVTQNNTLMEDVLDALRAAGVQTVDIQTRNLRLFPRYEAERQPQPGGLGDIIGYTAANQVEVRVRQVANVGEVIDAAIMAGANTIDGIHFEVSNPEQALDRAREAAFSDALRKAEQLAELADASLGNVMTITEYSRSPRPVIQEAMAMDAAAQIPIQAGTETIEVELQVIWYLE
jgi:uncharacterized protein